jgi:hypothetical protein
MNKASQILYQPKDSAVMAIHIYMAVIRKAMKNYISCRGFIPDSLISIEPSNVS